MPAFLEHFSKGFQKISSHDVAEKWVGKKIAVFGWVQNQRDHGRFLFFDLKDHAGLVQVFLAEPEKFSNHSVIAVCGVLKKRPEGAENPKAANGLFEISAEKIKILSHAEPLPSQDQNAGEEVQLKYRYLALRSPALQENLKLRARVSSIVRSFLEKENFLEVETPVLYKTTPEGARDYLVPSRLHKGKFYCLVQSPQILKQLLMVGGAHRYFQFAKCFRDEDSRSDRQPEFTQIDMEMSFSGMDEVMQLSEDMVRDLWKKIKNQEIPQIPSLSCEKALELYGTDKPDLRIPLQLKSLSSKKLLDEILIFKKALQKGGLIKSLFTPSSEVFTRGFLDSLTKKVQALGAAGLIYLKTKSEGGEMASSLPLDQKILKELFKDCAEGDEGCVFIIAGAKNIVNTCFSFLIPFLADKLSLIDKKQDAFLWVKDFPLVVKEEGGLAPVHHPFTAPEDSFDDSGGAQKLKDPEFLLGLKSKAYDLVCNGAEIAGGSIRNHNWKVQEALFQAMNLSKSSFEFFLEALKYGAPPHGGIAWGLDRLIMTLSGTDNIRDVTAFPKTLKSSCLMSGAPSLISEDRLLELGLSLKKGVK